jgi:hypothetical protein
MVEIVDKVINGFTSIPVEVWAALATAIGISGIVQTIKHKIGDGLSDKTLAGILTALSAVGAATDYLLGQAAQNPSVLGAHTAALVGLATLAYRFIVKPVYNLIVDAKAYRDANAPKTDAPAAATSTSATTEFPV